MVFVTIRGQLFYIVVPSGKYIVKNTIYFSQCRKIYGVFDYILYFPETTMAISTRKI